jgi:Phosphotransferase enzyme family
MAERAPRLTDALGDDIAALLAALPARVVRVTPVTSLSARHSQRATFRIDLDDGAALKARRFDSAFEAERFARLTRHAGHPQVPAATAQRGAAAIEPWIEGKSLAGQAIAPDEIHELGALLGAIHVAPPPARSEGELALAHSEREGRLAANIQRLVALKCIDDGERIRSAAGATPIEFEVGLIHGDFCPDNFVRTTENRIVAVDNETLRFEALDYDLARTWYRWPMDGAQASAFLDGYRTRRSPETFLRNFPYWAICALVDSAVFRAGAGIAGVDAVLQRLDSFIRRRPAFGSQA